MKQLLVTLSLTIFLTIYSVGGYTQTLVAAKVDVPPIIDGMANEGAWKKAQAIVTHDKVGKIDIQLKAVYTDKKIFFLVSYPDPDESRAHKSNVWNKELKIYEIGPLREDTFVLKWNMEDYNVDLSIFGKDIYKADIWFWKAFRTDPMGFADDKFHILSDSKLQKKYKKLITRGGLPVYLTRTGDDGAPAYKAKVFINYQGDEVPLFTHHTPSNSRADIQAKGVWNTGTWTIEFARALETGDIDDVQFSPPKHYHFGVSRYEIAGRKRDPSISQPLYGSGDISESLTLTFK